MRSPALLASGVPPQTPGYLSQDKGNGFLTFLCDSGVAVQGGIPMTAQGKGAAPSPCKRPKVLLPTLVLPPAFILASNIPAGGSRPINRAGGGL